MLQTLLFIHSLTLLFTQLNLCEVGISSSPERLQLSVQHFVRRVQSLQILNIEPDLPERSTAHFALFLSRSMLLMDHKRARHHIHLRSSQSQMQEVRHSIESIVHEALEKERRFNRQFHHIESTSKPFDPSYGSISSFATHRTGFGSLERSSAPESSKIPFESRTSRSPTVDFRPGRRSEHSPR